MSIEINGTHAVSCDQIAILVLTAADKSVIGMSVLNEQFEEFNKPIRVKNFSTVINPKRLQEHSQKYLTATLYNKTISQTVLTEKNICHETQTINYQTLSEYYPFVRLFAGSTSLLRATEKLVNVNFRFKRKLAKSRSSENRKVMEHKSTMGIRQPQYLVSGLCKINPNRKAFLVASLEDGTVLAIKPLNSKVKSTARESKFVRYSMEFSHDLHCKYAGQAVTITLINEQEETLRVIDDISSLLPISSQTELNNYVSNLLPSLGFFGGARNTPLEVEVSNKVRELAFVINQDTSYLNIRRLHLLDENGNLLRVDKDFEVRYSSSTSNEDITKKIFNDGGFHSNSENLPYIQVAFKRPTHVSKIMLQNRSDQWGSRIKNLEVLCKYGEQLVPIYSVSSTTDSLKKFAPFIDEYKINFNTPVADLDSTRKSLLRDIIDRTSIENLKKKPSKLDFLYSVLPTWSEKQSKPEIHELELQLLSLVFAYEMIENISVSCMPFTRILRSETDLNAFEGHINTYLRHAGVNQVKLAKHGFAPMGELIENTDNVMTALLKLINRLEDLGNQPVIAYGTLLGAHREKRFLPHDDDVDILIRLKAENVKANEVKQLLLEAVSKLPKEEFRVDFNLGLHNVPHVYCRQTGIMIDVFPYWVNGEKAYLHMEKMKVRSVDANIFAKREKVELYGSDLPVPIDIEGFLLERYGETWNVSDKFHEWPWRLQSN